MSSMPASIYDVKAKHQSRLMALPGVVSVGVGRDHDGASVIIVGFDRDRPDTLAKLPEKLEGYRVQGRVMGRIRTQTDG